MHAYHEERNQSFVELTSRPYLPRPDDGRASDILASVKSTLSENHDEKEGIKAYDPSAA